MTNKSSGKNTLLLSVLMSSPGPLVVGLGLLVGKSSTQLADFIRRSAELLAIIASYIIYRMTNKDGQDITSEQKERLEQKSNFFVGSMMVISGLAILFLSIFNTSMEKGNVIPGLIIALLGVIANGLFWVRYWKLSKQTNNSILFVQSRLYRAKFFVDLCVSSSLAAVVIVPQSMVTHYLDIIGSIVVSLYLIGSGLKTMKEMGRKKIVEQQ